MARPSRPRRWRRPSWLLRLLDGSGARVASQCPPWSVRVECPVSRDGGALPIEGGDASLPCRSHETAQLRVARESSDGGRGLLGGGEPRHDAAGANPPIGVASPLEELATGADVRGDDRNPRGAGLQDDQRL